MSYWPRVACRSLASATMEFCRGCPYLSSSICAFKFARTHTRAPPSSIGRAHATRPRGRAEARLAQSVERKALNLVVVGSSPTVGVFVDGNSSCDSHHLSVARWRGAALQNDTCHPSVLPCVRAWALCRRPNATYTRIFRTRYTLHPEPSHL
jgi:hypothetical protein